MTEKGVTPVIGIDLGSNRSCVGVWHQDKVEIIKNEAGWRATSSFVAFTPTECLIGDAAKNQWTTNLANTVYESQKLVGRRFNDPEVQKDIQRLNATNEKWWGFKVIKGGYGLPKYLVKYKGKERKYSPEYISSMILAKLKSDAESYLGATVKQAVISVPAYFNDSQREATKVAAHLAGLDVLQIVDEPVLAAIAYNGLDTNAQEKNVLVFYLDYYTFVVSVVTVNGKGNFSAKATGGDTRYGIVDLAKLLRGHFVKEFNSKHGIDLSGDSGALDRFWNECKKVIQDLSSATQTTVNIDDLKDGIDFSTNISRSEFEQIGESFFSKCIETVENCVRDAKINKTDVDDILFVGYWSTMIPKLQQLLEELVNGKKVLNSITTEHVVAYGATILATKLSRDKKEISKSLPLLVTVPLSLGVDAPDGVFSVIVPRSTPIPAHKQIIYFTASDNQNIMSFNVYQGERSRAKDNDWLGKFEVAVPLAPKGKSKVKVVFSVDNDGILTCRIKEFTTGLKAHIIIDNHKQNRSKEKIEKMLEDAQRYKMEDLEYKKIMCARCALKDYIYDVKRKMNTIGSTNKTRLLVEEIKKMENAIGAATQYLAENPEATDVDEHQRVLSKLQKLCVSVISQLV